MKDILRQYVGLKHSLETERFELQARLQEISAALGAGAIPAPARTAPGRRGPGRARKIHGLAVPVLAPVVRRGPGRAKGRKSGLSAAGRAAIIAAQKARWARVNAAKGQAAPKAVQAPARLKNKMSASGRAAIRAAVKARWAKLKAQKAGKKYD